MVTQFIKNYETTKLHLKEKKNKLNIIDCVSD